jgi:hypothetical protein
VPDDRRQDMSARIVAARVTVETLLGFSLEPDIAKMNLYTAETDPVVANRVFRFNPKDVYWPIDPASQIHSVMLIRPGDSPYTVTDATLRFGGAGWGKYLESCPIDEVIPINRVGWPFPSRNGYTQLVVDADWLGVESVPTDLKLVVAEFVAGSLEGNVRSETRGNRAFSRFDRKDPEKDPQVMRVLHRYAGPNGALR